MGACARLRDLCGRPSMGASRENCAGAWRLGSSLDRSSDCSGCRVVVLLNDKLFTNLLGVVIIASLFWLTTRALRGQRGEYG